jgi:hypothetical protein
MAISGIVLGAAGIILLIAMRIFLKY